MEKIDPYNQKDKFLKWKERAELELTDISEYNKQIFTQYINDMETGINVASSRKKGSRSYTRLNSIRIRILFIIRIFEKQGIFKVTELTEDLVHQLFNSMRSGKIRKKDGNIYQSVKDFVQDFKAFWHWWQKVNKKKGIDILDITLDLDTSVEKPKWVYLTEEEIKKLAENAKFNYKVLIWFLFDTGIRAPTEVLNIKVSDFFNDFKELNIRQETSKTFGRRIKLMLSSSLVRDYVMSNKLTKENYLFDFSPQRTNFYLKRLSQRLFGDNLSPAGEKYCNLTMYDFRHCSCCYWLPRYKSESALKYRFGWKESDKIHYYSELLGMRDTINQDDMLVDLTKTELEQRLEKSEKEKEIMQERIKTMELQVAKIMERTTQLELEAKDE